MTVVEMETSEEELWDKVLYKIYSRIKLCTDFITGKNYDPKKEMKRKKRQQEEEEFFFRGVTNRHTELHTLRMHMHL